MTATAAVPNDNPLNDIQGIRMMITATGAPISNAFTSVTTTTTTPPIFISLHLLTSSKHNQFMEQDLSNKT